jgi:hypothetical protein
MRKALELPVNTVCVPCARGIPQVAQILYPISILTRFVALLHHLETARLSAC